MERIEPEKLKGKKFLVVGLGKSGLAAATVLSGYEAEVSLQDSKQREEIPPQVIGLLEERNITCYFGCKPKKLKSYDAIIVSPGVDPKEGFIAKAIKKGIPVIGELEFAYMISKGKFIAITGTNGKTTTTSLVGEIFKTAGLNSSIVGNIGIPAVVEVVGKDESHWFITEVSSFQLETISSFKPVVSAILNLTPDHLNRHGTFADYGDAKGRIYENQDEKQYFITNADDEACAKLLERKPANAKTAWFSRNKEMKIGAYLSGDNLVVRNELGTVTTICSKNDLKIVGDHNVENALAAIAISYFAGIRPEIIARAIKKFAGVEHRMEFCGDIDGVSYYNDSKGTNVDASIVAIKAIQKNIILIAGGDSKEQDFAPLANYFDGHVKTLILLGRDKEQIEKAATNVGFNEIVTVANMEEAVKKATEISVKGDTVLLSPACASWDMYDNFEQRGEHFKDCVERLVR